MTVLDQFIAFAQALPAGRRREVEAVLRAIMDEPATGPHGGFTPEQIAELDRRMAEPRPEYVDPLEVEAVFRRHGVA